MSKGRKQSRDTREALEIFSDADFDADEFVEKMDGAASEPLQFRSGWRRLEQMRDEQRLRRALGENEYWEDLEADE